MLKMKIKINEKDLDLEVVLQKESNNRVAIRLTQNGYPYYTATVSLPDADLEEGYVFLKGWGKNEGLPEALEKAGVVKLTGRLVPTGFVYAQEAKIMGKSGTSGYKGE